jgi:hypothetical protein
MRYPATLFTALFLSTTGCLMAANPQKAAPPALAVPPAADVPYTPPASVAADPLTLRGAVVIRTLEKETMIIVRSQDSVAGSDVADHLFHFWSESPLQPINESYASADVDFRGDSLTLITPDKHRITTFFVDGTGARPASAPPGFTAAGFAGYGLNHEMGLRPAQHHIRVAGGLAVETTCNECPEFQGFEDPWGAAGGSGGCTVGGTGATSCSVSSGAGSCSISCSAPLHACCNYGGIATFPSCTCVH